MKLKVNGTPFETDSGIRVSELLERLALSGRRVAVAVNGEVTPRAQLADRVLQEGDEVEVIQAVAGG